jgi:hypothetical protein
MLTGLPSLVKRRYDIFSGVTFSMPAGITSTAGFEQEPCAPLGFVDPDFDQARTGDIFVLLTDVVGFAQTRGESVAVLA